MAGMVLMVSSVELLMGPEGVLEHSMVVVPKP